MMVTIREESELKEFVVTTSSEFARVGRKGTVFKLSTETLLLTFASDEVYIFVEFCYLYIIAHDCRMPISFLNQ